MTNFAPQPWDAPAEPLEAARPQLIVLFGATGDLAKRKLLPAFLHLSQVGLLPDCQIVGTSLDDLDDEGFRKMAWEACDKYARRRPTDTEWAEFAARLQFVPTDAGPDALATKVAEAEAKLPPEPRRLHYLSVPPTAAKAVVETLSKAGLIDRARLIMEKPFGTDLASARELNKDVHTFFQEDHVFRIDHFLGKEPALNILAFRFANGLFEPIWNRDHISHVQIDVPETLAVGDRAGFYEATGAFSDMVVTHLFQILAIVAMEPPTELSPRGISEEKNKVFRSLQPLDPANVVRGQYEGYRWTPGVAEDSDTETLVALRCEIDNWRWAGVPFFLRTGKRMAEEHRIISIAFHQPPKSMFPTGSGIGSQGPDHLTFDLADSSRLSLSFYGKRPGPGMRLDKLSMEFALHDTGLESDVLEAYERLIHDTMVGDHTLFTTAEGIEQLWAIAAPLQQNPPPVQLYRQGSWGPEGIHTLIAPRTWRLPFRRAWRTHG
ncbi:MAG: glucose-6-phosphate dehydrogenase [Acidimicrobiaceae bacterium]|nr:glucose-6-phosphate dehydrogenase [Acidimicrobiaceae bacterium]